MRRWVSIGFALAAALAIAATAIASNGKGEQRKFNAKDQAAARAATLQRTDLKPPAGWKGGAIKPDLSVPSCAAHPVDLSPYVMTGAAETDWTRGPNDVDSEAQVLQTAQMLAEEWRIQVTSPGANVCVRAQLARSLAASGGKLVSFDRIPFPAVAPLTRAYAVSALVSAQGLTLPVYVEVILIGKGRTGVSLTLSGLGTQRVAIAADAVRYAKTLASRIQV